MSVAEERLAEELEQAAIPGWDLTPQYRFHPERRWSFDFAFPSQRVAIEVEGKRHTTYDGHRKDCEKFNEAARLGWRVLRFPAAQYRRAQEWAQLVREVLLSPPPPST